MLNKNAFYQGYLHKYSAESMSDAEYKARRDYLVKDSRRNAAKGAVRLAADAGIAGAKFKASFNFPSVAANWLRKARGIAAPIVKQVATNPTRLARLGTPAGWGLIAGDIAAQPVGEWLASKVNPNYRWETGRTLTGDTGGNSPAELIERQQLRDSAIKFPSIGKDIERQYGHIADAYKKDIQHWRETGADEDEIFNRLLNIQVGATPVTRPVYVVDPDDMRIRANQPKQGMPVQDTNWAWRRFGEVDRLLRRGQKAVKDKFIRSKPAIHQELPADNRLKNVQNYV